MPHFRRRPTTLLFAALLAGPLGVDAQIAMHKAQNSVSNSSASTCPSIFAVQSERTSDILYSTAASASPHQWQNSPAKFASGTGNTIFLSAGSLLPLLEDGPNGKNQALRTADSLLTSALITEALKKITREKRPDGSDYDSFPSGHATAVFAVATMQSHYHPHQALLWYSGASLIAYSRVKLNRHRYHDVIAGAAVGYFTSRLELSQSHGLILSPFIGSKGSSNGLSLTMNF